MSPVEILAIVLIALASVVCVLAIRALQVVTRTARSLEAVLRDQVVPLLAKADVTVDAVNAEILRIDAIITSVEETSSRVSSASGTIHDIVTAPVEIVSGVADRVRRAWKDRHREEAGREGDAHAASGEPGSL